MYQDNHIRVYNKDCRDMSELPDESIQCCVTSPPYFGLRKYKGNQDLIWGGNHHEHQWGVYKTSLLHENRNFHTGTQAEVLDSDYALAHTHKTSDLKAAYCSLCGAWRGAYGLEPTPELYVEHTIQILREIRRVLRPDGIVFWNIGDSYAGGKGQSGSRGAEYQDARHKNGESLNTFYQTIGGYKQTKPTDDRRALRESNIKPKDLCLIPFRVALAVQADGWWVRSVIIWNKLNPMPESCRDRPTESHEYILLLTKSSKYYWDMEAVREPITDSTIERVKNGWYGQVDDDNFRSQPDHTDVMGERWGPPNGRNLRSVWTFATSPFPHELKQYGQHFATFPDELVERCIKAGTPEYGCCDKCGTPYERITQVKERHIGGGMSRIPFDQRDARHFGRENQCDRTGMTQSTVETLGWQQACKCKDSQPVPSLVLDPFAGSGTTLWVGKKLGRKAVGYEISEEYCQLAVERNRQQVLV